MKIELKVIDAVIEMDEKGRYFANGYYFDKDEPIYESDVIDLVKKYDKQNLRKYFPMYGFHN